MANLDDDDLRCPLKRGQIKEISHKVDIPAEVPKGKYTVLADVVTRDQGGVVTCLESVVYF